MTLLELMLAVGITAVIALMAYTALGSITQAKSHIDAVDAQQRALDLVMLRLQQDIQLTYLDANPTVATLTGQAGSVHILRLADAHGFGLPSQVQWVRWQVRDGVLVRAMRNALSPGRADQWLEQPLLPVAAFSCRYLGGSGVEQLSWPAADAGNALPVNVRCMLRLPDGLRTQLTAAPMAGMSL